MTLVMWAFILIALVAVVVALTLQQPKRVLAVLGGLVVAVVVVGIMLFGSYMRFQTTAPLPPPAAPQTFSPLPSEWEADVYPSVRAAMLSRVPMMEQVLSNLTGGASAPGHLRLVGDVDIDLRREFAERLAAEPAFADSTIHWRSGEGPATEEVININLNMHIDRQRRQHWSHNGARQDFNLWRDGRVMVTAARGGRTASPGDARFIEKPWVEDWSGFVADSLPAQNWLRAESRSPATDPHEAQQQAIEHAVAILMPMVQSSLQGLDAYASPPRHDLAGYLRGQLAQGTLITDRFIQRVDRPYGQLYTAALLIDGSPAAVAGVAAGVTQVHHAQRTHLLSSAASLGGLAAVIGLLYLFLNAATKGYFRFQLRMVAIAAGIILVMLLALV